MSRLPRPCMGAYDSQGNRVDCGRPTPPGKTRCDDHAKMVDRDRRPSPSLRGYDRQYRAERAEMLAERPLCELRLPGCTLWATTADHVVPVDGGRNRLAFRQPIRPSCAHCNSSRGKRAV